MEKNFNFPTFTVVETDLILDTRLSDSEKLLYSFIVVLCNNKENTCFATNSYFSTLMNCDTRTIQRYLFNLRKYGYIKIDIKEENRRTIQPMICKFIKDRKELFDYDWLNQ